MYLANARFLVLPVALLLLFAGITSAALAQSDNARLTPPLPRERDIGSFEISPDGATVVYRADQDTDGVFELYGAPPRRCHTASWRSSRGAATRPTASAPTNSTPPCCLSYAAKFPSSF